MVVGMKKRERKKMAPRFLACKTRWMVVISERGPGLFWWNGVGGRS